ncbi:hypothetical protein Ga0080559_TMP517 [Salipiger profundus]|uniref:Uncharacterized protein n=1 Tax=Salipiger profundus TaxID=1229727 RepID=A0A1U7CZP3_9RHOB|nr:hypothetical protein Ga0080559_TMP517 [Salipiger profundus]
MLDTFNVSDTFFFTLATDVELQHIHLIILVEEIVAPAVDRHIGEQENARRGISPVHVMELSRKNL